MLGDLYSAPQVRRNNLSGKHKRLAELYWLEIAPGDEQPMLVHNPWYVLQIGPDNAYHIFKRDRQRSLCRQWTSLPSPGVWPHEENPAIPRCAGCIDEARRLQLDVIWTVDYLVWDGPDEESQLLAVRLGRTACSKFASRARVPDGDPDRHWCSICHALGTGARIAFGLFPDYPDADA